MSETSESPIPPLNELLDQVTDFPSFLRFVEVLANERMEAEKLERADPERYRWSGALGWQNTCISTFLRGGIAYAQSPAEIVDENPPGTWGDLATFLYFGKIYE